MKFSPVIGLLVALMCVSAFAGIPTYITDYVAHPAVKTFTSPQSFNSFISSPNSRLFTVVKFFAPYCGACLNIKHEYGMAAERFHDDPNASFTLTEIDCTKDIMKPLCRKYQVRYYPFVTIIPSPYHGEKIPPHLAVDYQFLQPSFTASSLTLFLLQYAQSPHPFPQNKLDLKQLISAATLPESPIATNPTILHLKTFSEVQTFFSTNPSPYKVLLLLTTPRKLQPLERYHVSQQHTVDVMLSILTHYPSIGTIVTYSDPQLLSNAMIAMQDFFPSGAPPTTSLIERTTPKPLHIQKIYSSLIQRQRVLAKQLPDHRETSDLDISSSKINSIFDFTTYSGSPISTMNGYNKIILYTALPDLPGTPTEPKVTILSKDVLQQTYLLQQFLTWSLPILSPLTPQRLPQFTSRNKPIAFIFYPQTAEWDPFFTDMLYNAIPTTFSLLYDRFSFGYVDSTKNKAKVKKFLQSPDAPSLVIQDPSSPTKFASYSFHNEDLGLTDPLEMTLKFIENIEHWLNQYLLNPNQPQNHTPNHNHSSSDRHNTHNTDDNDDLNVVTHYTRNHPSPVCSNNAGFESDEDKSCRRDDDLRNNQ